MSKELILQALSIPSGYALVKLKHKLHPIHKTVLDSLFSNKKTKVSVRAANECGKSWSIITPAILFALDILNAQVVVTSASYRQIATQIMPYVKRYSHLFPKWEFLENAIKINGINKLIAFSSNEDAKFQGFHESDDIPLLICVDEAAGVKDQIFQSIGRCNPTYLLVTGSPLGPEGVFYNIETDKKMFEQFKHFKINKFDCLTKDGYWLDEKDVLDFVEMWGGKTAPLVLSSVYAEFADSIENGLVTLAELEKCYNYPPIFINNGSRHVGLDFAAGGDKNVIAFRNGNKVEIIKSWTEKDTMKACETFAIELNKLRDTYGLTQSEVSGDSDGLGIPMVHRLKDLGWYINEFHGNAAPRSPVYKNKVSECWIEGAKKIKTCSLILPFNDEFKRQLLTRKTLMHTNGTLMIEPKSELKKSPDEADAIMMALSNGSEGTLKFFKPIRTVEQYRPIF